MNNLSQISFFADEVSSVSKKYNDRNDVRTGECGVHLTTAVLQSWNIDAFLPSSDSAKTALRIQQIIAYETGIVEHPDPFGGSYVIEQMTEKFYTASMNLIEKIDSMGGAIEAINNGFVSNEISNSAYEYQKKVDSNQKVIVGVNKFEDKNEDIQSFQTIDPAEIEEQIKRLSIFKASRNNDQVNQSLKKLRKTAKGDENIMPDIIHCVKNDCTLGEISDNLRMIFGEHSS